MKNLQQLCSPDVSEAPDIWFILWGVVEQLYT